MCNVISVSTLGVRLSGSAALYGFNDNNIYFYIIFCNDYVGWGLKMSSRLASVFVFRACKINYLCWKTADLIYWLYHLSLHEVNHLSLVVVCCF